MNKDTHTYIYIYIYTYTHTHIHTTTTTHMHSQTQHNTHTHTHTVSNNTGSIETPSIILVLIGVVDVCVSESTVVNMSIVLANSIVTVPGSILPGQYAIAGSLMPMYVCMCVCVCVCVCICRCICMCYYK